MLIINFLYVMNINTVDLWKTGYIKNIDPQSVTSEIIESIYMIEKDAWSYGTWSYIGCRDCWEISSKSQTYSHLEISIRQRTVWEIESILSSEFPHCPCCSSQATFYIYDEKYRDESIAPRYSKWDSFLSLYYDISWEVRWFVDGYISDIYDVYDNEFRPYYQDKTLQILEHELVSNYGVDIQDPILSLNHMWAEQGYVSLPLLYNLLKTICENISRDFPHIDSIYDSILNNPIHGIHYAIWAEKLNMTQYLKPDIISDDFPVDMMFHKNGIETTLSKLWDNARSFFRENIGSIKKIVNG